MDGRVDFRSQLQALFWLSRSMAQTLKEKPWETSLGIFQMQPPLIFDTSFPQLLTV